MGLIEDLAKIRERQGKEPLPDPHHIEGFGLGHPPVPTERPEPIEISDDEEDYEYVAPETRTSPLVPKPTVGTEKPKPGTDQLAGIKLIVIDKLAAYSGVETILTDEESRQISVIVIGAQQRVLQGHLTSLRASTEPVFGPEVIERAIVPAAKKRGRPRKS